MKKFNIASLIIIFLSSTLQAQNVEGYDKLLLGTNKMIAVIIVLVIILGGIAVFLTLLEKRIKKLENQIKSK